MASLTFHRTPPAPAPAELIAAIQHHYGVSAGLAQAMAGGALYRTADALALVRRYKLVTNITTDDARTKGLIQ